MSSGPARAAQHARGSLDTLETEAGRSQAGTRPGSCRARGSCPEPRTTSGPRGFPKHRSQPWSLLLPAQPRPARGGGRGHHGAGTLVPCRARAERAAPPPSWPCTLGLQGMNRSSFRAFTGTLCPPVPGWPGRDTVGSREPGRLLCFLPGVQSCFRLQGSGRSEPRSSRDPAFPARPAALGRSVSVCLSVCPPPQ